MGNVTFGRSKSYSEVKEPATPSQGPSAADETPPKSLHVMSLIDPRSPNVEISRTPILFDEDGKAQDKRRYIREWMAAQTPIEKLRAEDTNPLFKDPRSPTEEISRTPICVTEPGANPSQVPEPACLSDSKLPNAHFDDSGDALKAAKKNFGDYDMSSVTGQMCRDLRKRLFISQKLNSSDTELLDTSTDTDKEN